VSGVVSVITATALPNRQTLIRQSYGGLLFSMTDRDISITTNLHGTQAVDFDLEPLDGGNHRELSPTELEWLCEAIRLQSDKNTVAELAICPYSDEDRLDLARVGVTANPKLLWTI
jgi:hypothetical protein